MLITSFRFTGVYLAGTLVVASQSLSVFSFFISMVTSIFFWLPVALVWMEKDWLVGNILLTNGLKSLYFHWSDEVPLLLLS